MVYVQRSAESEEKAQLRGIVSQLEKELASLLRQTEEARASLAKAEEERHKAGARVASCLSCVPKTDPDARRPHRVLGGKGDAAVENETKAYLTRESYEQVLLQIARVETQTKPLETRLEQLKTRQEAQRLTHTEKATSCREAFRFAKALSRLSLSPLAKCKNAEAADARRLSTLRLLASGSLLSKWENALACSKEEVR